MEKLNRMFEENPKLKLTVYILGGGFVTFMLLGLSLNVVMILTEWLYLEDGFLEGIYFLTFPIAFWAGIICKFNKDKNWCKVNLIKPVATMASAIASTLFLLGALLWMDPEMSSWMFTLSAIVISVVSVTSTQKFFQQHVENEE